MAINFMLPLRATQLLFAIISLGLDASFANWYNTHRAMASPSQVNFLVFTSVWTILATVYLTLTPMYMPRAAHKFAILAIEAITMIFWFAGFIALAVFISGLLLCSGTACKIAQAGTVFGAFEW
ncbi:hypothetical protein MMC14_000048 [Varicellaria rhodocarpa]|nr:hypothetical protein [Varicellaria rhodocarpa]